MKRLLAFLDSNSNCEIKKIREITGGIKDINNQEENDPSKI